ncbi:MAG: hypothetical protein ACR2FN_07415 [Chitinophagaceae bacterium]
MLKQKLGEKEAKLFIEYIETKVEENVDHVTKQLVTKEDLHKEVSNLHKTIYTVGYSISCYCWVSNWNN